MYRFIVLVLSLMIFSACSSYSTKKNITKSVISFNGGSFDDFEWDSSLDFNRTSWFNGITMSYDILIAKIEKKSKFSKWFDGSEKEYLDQCKSIYITAAYNKLGETSNSAYIKNEIESSGLKHISVSGFARHLKSHPNFQAWHLSFHKISAYCFDKMGNGPKVIKVVIPSFKTSNILN